LQALGTVVPQELVALLQQQLQQIARGNEASLNADYHLTAPEDVDVFMRDLIACRRHMTARPPSSLSAD
jgi:hypothetical protein